MRLEITVFMFTSNFYILVIYIFFVSFCGRQV